MCCKGLTLGLGMYEWTRRSTPPRRAWSSNQSRVLWTDHQILVVSGRFPLSIYIVKSQIVLWHDRGASEASDVTGSRLFYLPWPTKTLLVAVTSMHAVSDKLHAMLSDAFAINTGTPCGAPVDRTALREPFDDLCLWWLTSSRWSSIREPACELDDAGW